MVAAYLSGAVEIKRNRAVIIADAPRHNVGFPMGRVHAQRETVLDHKECSQVSTYLHILVLDYNYGYMSGAYGLVRPSRPAAILS